MIGGFKWKRLQRSWQLTFLLIFSRPQACTVPGLDLLWNCGIETPTATYPPWQKMTRTEPKRQLHFLEFSFPRGHACFTWHVKVGCLSERLTVTQEDWVRLYDFHYSSSHHVNWVRNYTVVQQRCRDKRKLIEYVYVPSHSEIQDLQRFKHTESVNPSWVFTVV